MHRKSGHWLSFAAIGRAFSANNQIIDSNNNRRFDY